MIHRTLFKHNIEICRKGTYDDDLTVAVYNSPDGDLLKDVVLTENDLDILLMLVRDAKRERGTVGN